MIAEHKKETPKLFRIRKVTIRKLFGQVDYEIPLDLEERVTILFGLNGTGKTTILKILGALSSGDFTYLDKAPFEFVNIEMDHGSIAVEKSDNGMNVIHKKKGRKRASLSISFPPFKNVKELLSILKRGPRTRAELKMWEHFRIDEEHLFKISEATPDGSLDFSKLDGESLRSILYIAANSVDSRTSTSKIDKLMNLLDGLPCHLLPAARLIEFKKLPTYLRRQQPRRRTITPQNKVVVCANQLAHEIDVVRNRYSDRVQALDRGFAKKVLEWRKEKRTQTDSGLEVDDAAREIEGIYQKLVSAGLVEETEETLFDPAELQAKEFKPLRPFFAAHYDNLEKKLGEFENLLEKVMLFTQVVDEFYIDKSIRAHKEKGLIIVDAKKPSNRLQISLEDLSSGEQHILILAFDLIFEAKRNQLVMIDEPELSLHVTWQRELVRSLRRIGSSSDLYFLLATHSPLMLDEGYESSVELKGLYEK